MIRNRGGFPRVCPPKPRKIAWLVNELRWQCFRYAELLAWDPALAALVHSGEESIGFAVIAWRLKFELYDGEFGTLLSIVDQWYWNPQAQLKYLASDATPQRPYPPDVYREVDLILARLRQAGRDVT